MGDGQSQPPANPRSAAAVPSRIPLEKEASHELLGGLHHDEGASLPIHQTDSRQPNHQPPRPVLNLRRCRERRPAGAGRTGLTPWVGIPTGDARSSPRLDTHALVVIGSCKMSLLRQFGDTARGSSCSVCSVPSAHDDSGPTLDDSRQPAMSTYSPTNASKDVVRCHSG